MSRKLLRKEELRQILDDGWEKRREENKKKSQRKSENAKKWKDREKKGENKDRQKHFLEFRIA